MALIEAIAAPTGISYPHIVATPGTCGGRPRIDGTRISVQVIAEYYHLYHIVDRILEALPHLTYAEVHAALTFYFDHQAELDEEIRKWSDKDFLRSRGYKIYPDDLGKT
jgi:uncharacterized protein (DUF433 family)